MCQQTIVTCTSCKKIHDEVAYCSLQEEHHYQYEKCVNFQGTKYGATVETCELCPKETVSNWKEEIQKSGLEAHAQTNSKEPILGSDEPKSIFDVFRESPERRTKHFELLQSKIAENFLDRGEGFQSLDQFVHENIKPSSKENQG